MIESNNTVTSSSMINSIVTKIVNVNDIEIAFKMVGHGVMFQYPREFTAVVETFLSVA